MPQAKNVLQKHRVLIVDDSSLIRSLLSEILSQSPDLKVVGMAADPYEAREKIKTLKPDVLTLDIEMPKMNGITFLKNLMRLRPMPVVMISTLTEKGAPATLEALRYGAVDFLAKPKADVANAMKEYANTIIQKVTMAAKANLRAIERYSTSSAPSQAPAEEDDAYVIVPNHVIAIGASTGGTEAILNVLMRMPQRCPPIVVTQHIPPTFSKSFADRVDRISKIKVSEAHHGQAIKPGQAYIAPGDKHLKIERSSQGMVCKLVGGERVSGHKPSVDVLFDSVLEVCGKKASGAILTGMGSDGAKGLLRLKQAGCYTLAQDEKTSVVWGMPGAAVKLGAVKEQCGLDDIAERLMKSASRPNALKAQ